MSIIIKCSPTAAVYVTLFTEHFNVFQLIVLVLHFSYGISWLSYRYIRHFDLSECVIMCLLQHNIINRSCLIVATKKWRRI